MLDYTKIESRLKSFLKNNKKLGFSVALLVTFLINGDFSYTDEVLKVPVVTRQELQEKIVADKRYWKKWKWNRIKNKKINSKSRILGKTFR